MKEKRKHKIVIGSEILLLCMIMGVLGTNAASANPPSNGVSYNKNGQVTVQNALDDLYNKANYGNASAGQILSGKTALVGGKKVTGTFTCPTLASLTPGNATPEDITDGKIAWVNGEKVIGTGQLELVDKLKIGDYVRYTPSSTSYTISKEDTNYGGDQKIDPSELRTWRVIRKNRDGTVELVSGLSSTKKVYIWHRDKYIKTLNKIAKAYETEGITAGSRHIGYNTSVSEDVEDSVGDAYYLKDIQALETLEAIDELVTGSRGSWKGQNYWLAAIEDDTWYRGLFVNMNGVVGTTALSKFNENGTRNYNSAAVRPIIVLKSDLKITGGDGTEDSPYTIGA